MTDAKDERRPAGELEAAVMAALWAAEAAFCDAPTRERLIKELS